MNVEQRLIEVFQTSRVIEPAPDLYSRVVHSIEEDRRLRRRVLVTASTALAALAALVVVGAVSMEEGPSRLQGNVHRPTMELLEWIALIVVLLAVGPGIRRFGRGYANDLWPSGAITPVALVRLMDVAYYLIGAGYVLLSAEFDFNDAIGADRLSSQLAGASLRLGGLLLTLGLLHATMLFLLPIVALIDNSTRRSRPLPRWVILLLVMIVLSTVPFLPGVIGVALS